MTTVAPRAVLKSREYRSDLFSVRVIPPAGLPLPLSTHADRDLLANVRQKQPFHNRSFYDKSLAK
jgi:hypothetical protein